MNLRNIPLICYILLNWGCRAVQNDDLPTAPPIEEPSPSPTPAIDDDNDGFNASIDCDDDNAESYPGAEEFCDQNDNNCDGTEDEDAVDATWWYADRDDDGFGAAEDAVLACEAPSGNLSYVTNDFDCDDAAPYTNPSSIEVCDGAQDEDCDGDIDEPDAQNTTSYYADTDGDGYGDESTAITACSQPEGAVANNDDCNDSNAAIHPGVTEVCNDNEDNDCDGTTDQLDLAIWYYDGDGDGFGSDQITTTSCEAPSDYVGQGGDCDDSTVEISPAAAEFCNEIDDDCDSIIDEGDAVNAGEWYPDNDGDGYGDETESMSACSQPDQTTDATLALDCDDSNAEINPDADEVCDEVNADEDCDGKSDDADNSTLRASKILHYPDTDRDGFGDLYSSQTLLSCDAPDEYAPNNYDCNDTDASIYPGAAEVANSIDDDCDGRVDEGTSNFDDDGDGYAEVDGDCNDADASIGPGTSESCNNWDDNCNTIVDDVDADDDGYYSNQCGGTDCDDSASTVYPGAPEDGSTGTALGNQIDDNCNGEVDEGLLSTDDDGDGFSEVAGDCDDTDPKNYPGATEALDGIDNNCDGQLGTIFDADQVSVTIHGVQAEARVGYSVALLRDVTGDGVGDLLIGAPTYSNADGAVGAAYLLTSNSDGWLSEMTVADAFCYEGTVPGSETGFTATYAGDVNSDGYGDFAVGAPGHPGEDGSYVRAGAAYLIAGAPSGWQSESILDRATLSSGSNNTTLGTAIYGIANYVELGFSVGGGGDVTGDSFADLLIGGPCDVTDNYLACRYAAGWLMVLPGNETFDETASVFELAKMPGDSLNAVGYSIAYAGHTDADEIGDLVVSGHYNAQDYGVMMLVPGTTEFTAGTEVSNESARSYLGETEGEFIGSSVAGGHDFDGDGADDVLFGKSDLVGGIQMAFLIYGATDGLLPADQLAANVAASAIVATDTGDVCPCRVAAIGDLNQDGYGDFAVSSLYRPDIEMDAGVVYLFFGRAERFSGDILTSSADVIIRGVGAKEEFGFAMSGGFDLNSDGYDDFAIGAPYAKDSKATEVGRVSVVYGFDYAVGE